MDRDGIERGLLFPSAGLYLTSVEEETYAAAFAAPITTGSTIIAARIADGCMAVGAIPVQDVNAAVAETKRVVNELGFKGSSCGPIRLKAATSTIPTTTRSTNAS